MGRSTDTISGLVSRHIIDIMLGIDWLIEIGASWDIGRGELCIDGVKHRLAAGRTGVDESCWLMTSQCRHTVNSMY